ncbi:DUF397 domain-containing protein [Streptomyces clavuligerus]|uniref:DUF397 domain-containing protein n=1 Tax=Streptomyces clavuligerus TaxID=1901 RepID=E2PYG2_STRCL|nr:DUF397 domain-containing protein [Streptomyces clavuligerus]ANW20780.1 DUF397 domain-containing protein [Streptomyces clavuligerus]AXU15406.1 DUF397 domain-containing protein [Streptomyces clavuligerus]EFG06184.1 DUF397 domain-containing protein [Streptomyces clavuligerus]MBY6305500.1 DUF397 domain-containing protein [Streptomyces clavuligerus]QCS08181.1 DUF397 domain-containing protein [Streptomyces clavuligerus]
MTDCLRWVKSSYSTDNGGTCVEWAPGHASATGVVPVRDSKRADGPVLMVSAPAFVGLVALARSATL